ncbi:Uu.00g102430.m01.CDS01 [Anthostomella pinea]|uniref:Uu.00g102430.m01.CDS01 n=1 Tax=Anthostomella pinea TaxID=933095 RepID=A0AAI8YFM6_9PEZI|nr:Uu.00g102430.m01.CDS01 [Anthostomella pinea]
MATESDGTRGAPPARSQPDMQATPNDATIPSNAISDSPLTSPTNPSEEDTLPSSASQGDLVSKVFQFLSTATPGTLGAIGAGLAATTYFILGKVGLVLIGAFGGITLFAAWESRHPEVSRAVRGEKGYDFLDRLFETRPRDSSTNAEQDELVDAQTLARSFDDFRPETRAALNEFVDATIRDYVEWWYGPIVPSDQSFSLSSRKVLIKFLLNLSNRLSRKRPADAFVDFVTHTCSIIIVFFSEMASAYSELPTDTNMTAADAIYNYLATNRDAPLSNLLNQRQQAGKFKTVAEDLLGFLEKPARDFEPARIFLREILSTIVLEGTLQTCSKPEWINTWIVYLLESGETDLSQAIDDAIQDQKAYSDVDGNVGNIGLSKGNRNSYDMDRQRRKELTHKKKLSKADEEMERAMEEMKRLNAMIAEADQTKGVSKENTTEAPSLLDKAVEKNARELLLNIQEKATRSTPESTKVNGPKVAPKEAHLDKAEARQNSLTSPTTSRSSADSPSHNSSPSNKEEPVATNRFTSFDQFVPPARDDPEDAESHRPQALTLHNAAITIHDDVGNDKGRLRSKPTWEYLIQVEPSSSQQPGWMIMKTYTQFEGLHESIRRIAAISGATAFLEAHSAFPSWKLHTRSSLRGEIERYMRTACVEKTLAESEAMKRFLDKSQETKMGVNRGFSFESMGKGMLDVIQNAPKGALDGGKGLVGGVTGVFGNIGLGPKRSTNSSLQEIQTTQGSGSLSPASSRPVSLPALPRMDSASSVNASRMSRDSLDSQRSSIVSVQPGKLPLMDRRPSYQADMESQECLHPARADRWERKSTSGASSRVHSRTSSLAALRSPSEVSLSNMKLPPPPTEIADDYDSPTSTRLSTDGFSRLSTSLTSPTRSLASTQHEKLSQVNGTVKRPAKQHAPLSEQETRVAVELMFAVINELYTLSSAWNIRRTLLTAAKTFLLRPGNPSLVSIKSLIQESVLETNTSDEGIAAHLRKLRENSLPTEEERKAWPAELTVEEKEELRVKARKLFIQSSVPAALMGIMGQSATSEALGRVFDCLQIEEVARGLFFGIILQAVRVITH